MKQHEPWEEIDVFEYIDKYPNITIKDLAKISGYEKNQIRQMSIDHALGLRPVRRHESN